MRTLFAEYNPQCNSIDVYTSAVYMLRIDCWKAEKNLKTTPLFRLCIKCSRHWWTTWICKIISWWQFTDVGRCRRFFRIMIMSKGHRIFWRILANQAVTHCPSDSLVTCYPWYLILSTSVSFFRLLLKTQESTICNRPTKKTIIKIGTIGTW